MFNINAIVGLTAKQEDEPNPLYVDSLLPISADIDPENEYKRNLARINTLGESTIKMRNKAQESRLSQEKRESVKLLDM
jgi:hypothetical protein